MNNLFLRLWAQIEYRRRWQLCFLVIVTLLASLAEMVSIGSVVPFIGVLLEPDKLLGSPIIEFTTVLFSLQKNQLLFALTTFFVIAVLFSGGMRIALLWTQTRLGFAIGADISLKLYTNILYQPYSSHLSRNSSQIIAAISGKTNSAIYNYLLQILLIASSSLILLCVITMLTLMDLRIALTLFGGFGTLYILIVLATKKTLARDGRRVSNETDKVVKAMQEGLGGIRDIIIDGTQGVFCQLFRDADEPLRRAQANIQVIAGLPRFIIESLGLGLIAAVAYTLTVLQGDVVSALPILGAFAIGAQRLLPTLQQIYHSWSVIEGARANVSDVLDLLEEPTSENFHCAGENSVVFEKKINIKDTYFRYDNERDWALNNINIIIEKGSRTGIIGTTGSGKSTLVDIIMGLLEPTFGSLIVDDEVITCKNSRSWQRHIAHVPQSIFLCDATIAENIAFGTPKNKINIQRVADAAKKAQISGYIESLKNGYNTIIGERGVRLSGGQRQRIGIARALYKNAQLIILDESTNALDGNTETAVMEAIQCIDKNVTILIVAHRTSTLAFCTNIIELEAGNIKRTCSYNDLHI